MQGIFERFMSEEKGSAAVDWAVLFTGFALIATSLFLTVVGTSDRAAAEPPKAVTETTVAG